ncbi:MAG: carboxylesterase family protein [Solobacterium sp.]|nr:carboxylesterase family protein [Solobacterium sp.]
MHKDYSSIGFSVFLVFISLILTAVLELNRNTVPGFVLLILLAVLFGRIRARYPFRGFLKKLLSWICFFLLYAGILFLTWPPVKSVPAVSYPNPEYTDIISVEQGELRGVLSEDGSVEIYAGIPYAKPPVNDLRWMEPQDTEPWDGVLDADTFAPMSMQVTNLPIYSSLAQIIGYHDYQISLQDNYREPVSEDSLYLNIWKPAGDVSDLPVVVYIHGGSLQTGQPWYADYGGEGLAKQDVIVVNMGYRLGLFGFYADEELAEESEHHTTGNYGLLDQIKALKWVRDNISAFGGNPDNVTLAGESAGSACVSALCTSPLAEGLFVRAVGESSSVASVSPPHSFRHLDEALKSGNDLKQRHNVASVQELRALPAEELVSEAASQHHITVDGYVLTETPYESYQKGIHNEQQLLHGYNSEESAPFLLFDKTNLKNWQEKVQTWFGEYADEVISLYPCETDEDAAEAWADIYGSLFFNYPHYCWNRMAGENDIPVYEYLFSKTNGRLGPWHSGEEVYFYGNIPENSDLYTTDDRQLSKMMSGYFASFAKDGDPNGPGLPEWRETSGSRELMEFGDHIGMIEEKHLALYEILDRMYGLK